MEENMLEKVASKEENDKEEAVKNRVSKEEKSGIIYLSRIPTGMNASIIRQYFNRFGETGRIFLQQHQHGNAAKRNKKRRLFSEGWIEFNKKKVAKKVAASLNNAQIGGKKKNQWREELWNIKYLPRFKWSHLHERLVYEKAVHSQRLRAEITQAKREANFYIENAEKNAKIKRKAKKQMKVKEDSSGETVTESSGSKMDKTDKVYEFRQKATEDDIVQSKSEKRKHGGQGDTEVVEKKRQKKRKSDTVAAEEKSEGRKSFLTRIFSGGVDSDGD